MEHDPTRAPDQLPGDPRGIPGPAQEAAARMTAEVVGLEASNEVPDIYNIRSLDEEFIARLTPIDQLQPSDIHPERIIEVIRRLDAYIQQSQSDPEHSVLYPEQVPPFEDLLIALRIHGATLRGFLPLPTGVGKGVMIAELAKVTGMKTLFVTPRLLLLQQLEEAFKVHGEEVQIGLVYGDKKQTEEAITGTPYQSLRQHAGREKDVYRRYEVELLILDEGHEALSPKTQEIIKDYFPNAIIIGFTATDKYSHKKKLGNLLPVEIHRMTLQEAYALNLIAPISNWIVRTGLRLSNVGISESGEYDMAQLGRAINLPERNLLVAKVYREKFDGKKGFVFAASVQHAVDLAETFRAVGIRAEAAHGRLTLTQQAGLIKRLKSHGPDGLDVLCSDQLLLLGTDVPEAVVSLHAVATRSLLREQQRGGRTPRRDPNNPDKRAYVVDFVDEGYRLPPVLFADPDIADSAHFGDRPKSEAPDEVIAVPGGSGVLVTDPNKVEAMAREFAALREVGRLPRAPEDWLSATEIAEKLGIRRAVTVLNAIAKLRAESPAFVERGADRFTGRNHRRVTLHYSPVIVETLEKRRAELLERREQKPPKDWIWTGLVGAIYGVTTSKVQKELIEVTKGNPNFIGMYPTAFGGKKGWHCSPEAVKKWVDLKGKTYIPPDQAPPNWMSRREFSTQYPPRVIAEAAYFFRKHYPTALSKQALPVGREVYWGPKLIRQLVDYMQRPKRWVWLRDVATELDATEGLLDRFLMNAFKDDFKEGLVYFRRLCVDEGVASVAVDPRIAEPLKERFRAARFLQTQNPRLRIPGFPPPA